MAIPKKGECSRLFSTLLGWSRRFEDTLGGVWKAWKGGSLRKSSGKGRREE